MAPQAPPEQIDAQSLDDYLEIMAKVVFESGMSWKVVENKWSGIREAFHNFDIHTVADMVPPEIDDLVQDTRVIRNRRKLEAIVSNAQKMLDLEAEHGSFKTYLNSFDDFDDAIKTMKKDFKFLGVFGTYYFLYVVKEPVPPHDEFQAKYRK
ncbi:MAG: DNA-3-methyladenine glycosylase I [Anaerolineales bacterium]|jgi:3-methyladenine DNA glycosylase Tag